MSAAATLGMAFAAAFVFAALATRCVLRLLLDRQIFDVPNKRSSHARPVPRGGGLGVMAGLLPVLAAAALIFHDTRAFWFAPGLTLLIFVSWRDDKASQSAWLRLACQIAAVAIALGGLPSSMYVFQGGLPLVLDRLLAAILWIWFVNLTNFMDGIDGITGIELATIGIGVAAIVVGLALPDSALAHYAAAIGGAAAGFLVWNWHPAKLFLGDVGSVPLGFLAGGLLVLLAAHGAYLPALILPAYYLADATLTLFWRLGRGEPVMQAHRQHWYQHAASRIGHPRTALAILGLNVLLVGLAADSLEHPIRALLAANAAVAILLGWMSAMVRKRT